MRARVSAIASLAVVAACGRSPITFDVDPDPIPAVTPVPEPKCEGCPPVRVTHDINLSKDALTEGRACAEGPQYAVTALTATAAMVAQAPRMTASSRATRSRLGRGTS